MKFLTCLQTFAGSQAAAYLGAFRRAGHVVYNVDPLIRAPAAWGGWTSTPLRALARPLAPILRDDLNRTLARGLEEFAPDGFFTFKGAMVSRRFIEAAESRGVPTLNFFPDVSMTVHGSTLVRALPSYTWIFTSKAHGEGDLARQFGRTDRVAWIPHAADPDLHRIIAADPGVLAPYAADVVFVGTWSPRKQATMERLVAAPAMARRRFRIWGDQWLGKSEVLAPAVEGRSLTGDEYVLALNAAKVALALLSEQRPGASSGDRTTTRTFEIPACGAAMVHPANDELRTFFEPGVDCLTYTSDAELAARVAELLEDDELRASIAASGHARVHRSRHTVDARLETMLGIAGMGGS